MSRIYIKNNGVPVDALLYTTYVKSGSSAVQFREGDFIKKGNVVYPLLREESLSLGIRTGSGNMTLTYSFNDTLLNNPVIVMMGSSHCISLNLSFPDRLQDKIQAWFDANHGGCTIHNIGVAGEYTDHWLPTTQGGLADRNIDMALSFNPDIILLIGPTNDVLNNTTAQCLANLQIIRNYARQHGAKILIHSPVPRGDFNATQVQGLVDNNAAWLSAFPYEVIRLFNSALNNGSNGINPTYYQGDNIHLNATGTTYQATGYATAVIPTLVRELRANTAYKNFIVKRSDTLNGTYTTFDTITNQQTIKKTYTLQAGFYKVTATLKNDTVLPDSNTVEVIVPTNVFQVMFSKASITPPTDWLNASGDPFANNNPSATHPTLNWSVRALGAANWGAVGNSNSQDGRGALTVDSNGTTYQNWPLAVFGNFWYNGDMVFNPGTPVFQLEINGLNVAKTYKVLAVASRSNAAGATGPYSTLFSLQDNTGIDQLEITDTYQGGNGNTHLGVMFTGQVPRTGGILNLAVNKGSTGSVGHICALVVIEE